MSIVIGLLSFVTIIRADQAKLDQIRSNTYLPAIVASAKMDGTQIEYISGVRKWGDETKATVNDKFHLGSCTKAMTATLLAIFIERGKLKWDTPLEILFPDLVDQIHPDFKKVPIEYLTTHYSGIDGEMIQFKGGSNWKAIRNEKLNPVEGRTITAKAYLSEAPKTKPGTRFEYSNVNYMIVGAALERISGKSWEVLMQEELFKPLHMDSCGFGSSANPKSIVPDQPWPHIVTDKDPKPLVPDFDSDNPPSLGPAGSVHCSMKDWTKFAELHVDGFNGKDTSVLKAKSFVKLHTVFPGDEYTYGGWGRLERKWADGPVLTHSGSNTFNYSVIWIAPKKKWVLTSATNVGTELAYTGLDAAIGMLVKEISGN